MTFHRDIYPNFNYRPVACRGTSEMEPFIQRLKIPFEKKMISD